MDWPTILEHAEHFAGTTLGTVAGVFLAGVALSPGLRRKFAKAKEWMRWGEARFGDLHHHADLRLLPPPDIDDLDGEVSVAEAMPNGRGP